MATTTTNYELTKAGYNDIPDIETINDNMDTLDSSLVVGESNDDVMETITKTTGWTNAEPVTLGDKFQSAMTKISTMIKNLKWIYKFIGSTDISSIGDGTITNAISTLSSNKLNASNVKTSLTDTSTAHALSTASGKALNDAFAAVSNSSFSGDLGTMYVYKYHKILLFQWAGNGTELPSNNFTFTTVLPTAYRPVYNVISALRTSGNSLGYIQISTDGTITISTTASANRTWSSANAVGVAAH